MGVIPIGVDRWSYRQKTGLEKTSVTLKHFMYKPAESENDWSNEYRYDQEVQLSLNVEDKTSDEKSSEEYKSNRRNYSPK